MKKLAFVFAAIAGATLTGANAEELGVRVGGDRDYRDRDFRAARAEFANGMSVVPSTAEDVGPPGQVRFVPECDMAGLGRYERGCQLRRPYLGAAGDESHSLICEAVSSWRSFCKS